MSDTHRESGEFADRHGAISSNRVVGSSQNLNCLMDPRSAGHLPHTISGISAHGESRKCAAAGYPITQVSPPRLTSERVQAQPPRCPSGALAFTHGSQAFVHPPLRPVPQA